MVSLGVPALLRLLAAPLQVAQAAGAVPGVCLAQLRSHVLVRVASDRQPEHCYGELPGLAVTEGSTVGATVSTTSASECRAACDAEEGCGSFSLCPQWNGCWLKDRSFSGSEASREYYGCTTFYRTSCGPLATPTPEPTMGAEDCYGELDGLAIDEGYEVGDVYTASSAECTAGCSANTNCMSVSFCPQWNGCWLKDRSLSGSESTKEHFGCRTYYKRSCSPTPAPTSAPTPLPTPASAPTPASTPAPTPLPTPALCSSEVPAACQAALDWAMRSGIHEHPEWYPGLTASSTAWEFQARLHSIGTDDGACPMPCATGEVPAPQPGAPQLRVTVASLIQFGWQTVSFLQVEGAEDGGTLGGPATSEKRTVYFFTPDDGAGTPTYSGDRWPIVLVPEGASIDVPANLLVPVAQNADRVLLIDGKPAYQFTADASAASAGGNAVGGVWFWFEVPAQSGTPSPAPTPPPTRPPTPTPSPTPAPAPPPSSCRDVDESEPCHGTVTWAMQEGIYGHPEWYPGLTPSSSFRDFQRYLHDIGADGGACPAPCSGATLAPAPAPAPSPTPAAEGQPCHATAAGCTSIGVNVFGGDGFADDAALRRAVSALFTNGIRSFRVVNVGAWQDGVLAAINDAAAAFGVEEHTVLQITSMFFNSPASCSSLPSWMDFSLETTARKLRALENIRGRVLVQLDTCSICSSSQLQCMNPTEQAFGQDSQWNSGSTVQNFRSFINDDGPNGYGRAHLMAAHDTLPSQVEFVIPYMNDVQSPTDMVSKLVRDYAAPLQAQGRKVHIEGTFYPFWVSSEQVFASYPKAQIGGFISAADQLGFDGFVVAETGWPQTCPYARAGSTRPPTLENMCRYFTSVLSEGQALAVETRQQGVERIHSYIWKFGPQDDGSCGDQTWGLFGPDGAFACEGLVTGWA